MSVAFSPDGKTLAAGYGATVSRRRGAVGRANRRRDRRHDPLAVSEGHVASVAFSPDGKTLAAGYGRPMRRRRGGAVGRGEVAAVTWRRTRSP